MLHCCDGTYAFTRMQPSQRIIITVFLDHYTYALGLKKRAYDVWNSLSPGEYRPSLEFKLLLALLFAMCSAFFA